MIRSLLRVAIDAQRRNPYHGRGPAPAAPNANPRSIGTGERQALLTACATVADREGTTAATVASRALGYRVGAEHLKHRQFGTGMAANLAAYLSNRWPAGVPWPCAIERPRPVDCDLRSGRPRGIDPGAVEALLAAAAIVAYAQGRSRNALLTGVFAYKTSVLRLRKEGLGHARAAVLAQYLSDAWKRDGGAWPEGYDRPAARGARP